MMRTYQLLRRGLGSSILLALLAVLIAGCSIPFLPTSFSTTGATSTGATSATACPSPVPSQAVRGTIKSINGSTVVLTDANGNSVTATYTSTTRFTRQAKVSTSALVSGTFIFVAVTQNADNSYTATMITLSNGGNRGSRFTGGFGAGSGRRGNAACRRGQRGNNGASDFAGGTANTRSIMGTVSRLSGKTLTVTDVNQADYTVTLNSTTQIIQTSQASATSLQVGMRINLVGLRNAQGVITARSVTILLSGSGNGKGA